MVSVGIFFVFRAKVDGGVHRHAVKISVEPGLSLEILDRTKKLDEHFLKTTSRASSLCRTTP